MEYAKDEIFNIHYNEKLDKLEIKGRSRAGKWKQLICGHKFMTLTITSFILFSLLDIYLVYQFVKIFEAF